MSRVMVHQADYDNCRKAIDRAFDLFPVDVKSKKVLVKPNALRSSDAEQGIVTHPAVVRAIVEKLEELGDHDASSIEIVGDLAPLPKFKGPPIAAKTTEIPTGEGEFFSSRIRLRPEADKDLCTACETCIEHCPVSALSMIDNLPVVGPERCIACFCCQEMCPDMAIKLS